MKLIAAAKTVEEGVVKTLNYTNFPMQHWTQMRTNNAIERLKCEIRRRTRVVGTFADDHAALMLVGPRCKYVAESDWKMRRYLDVSMLEGSEA